MVSELSAGRKPRLRLSDFINHAANQFNAKHPFMHYSLIRRCHVFVLMPDGRCDVFQFDVGSSEDEVLEPYRTH